MDGEGHVAPPPPMLLLPTTTDSGCMGPPVICEQGPSAPSSPTSPGGSRLRRPSPLTPEAMRRINLLTSGYPQSMDMSKLSPLSPNYPTSDLGSSPRSSISVTTSGLGPYWTGFRDHKKSSSDFTDGDSDICSKDLLSPGMMLSPAPFSPFSDCTDPPGTPYSAYGAGGLSPYGAGGLSPNLSPLLPVRGLHFSFDPIRSPSSLSMGNGGNYLLVPSSAGSMGMGRLTKESRERSRSDSEMTSSAKKMADEESAMETDLLQSTVSVPTATAKAATGSTGQYKKRLLHKYEQEQEDRDRKFTRARLSPPDHPEPSPPAVAEGSEVEDGSSRQSSRQPSRQPTIEEPPQSPSPDKPPQQLSSAIQNALTPQPQFDYWLQQQLLAWQNAWYRNPTLLPPAGVQLPTPHGLIGVHAPSPQLLVPPPLAGHHPRGHLRHTPSPTEAGPGGAPGPIKAQLWRRSRSESDVTGNFVCQHCGQAFSLHDRLAKHIASRHRDRSASVAAGEDCPSKSHKCNVCHKSFGRSDMLTRHMRLHTGLKPYGCHICGQVFSRSDHLSTHQRTHTGEKPYQCPQCSYAASRRDMITRHMRTHSRSGGVGTGPLGPDYGSALPLASLSLNGGGHCSPTDLLRSQPPSVLSVVSEHQQLPQPSLSSGSSERRPSSGGDGEQLCSSSPSSKDRS